MAETTVLGKMFIKSSKSMRRFLLMSALLMLLGIWLTGFNQVHWVLYIVPVFYNIGTEIVILSLNK